MNRFVEECRREWKRLRVPDPVADEMAADLAADLEEAETEGASPQEVLGSGASDPRSFAASWAAERGVIAPGSTAGLRSRSLMPAALAALTITAAVGAALVIFASPDASRRVALVRLPPPPASLRIVSFDRDAPLQVVAVAPTELEEADGSGVEIHTVGSILLIIGIVGVMLSTLFLFWSPSRRFDTARS